jgi:hypothetical protein
MTTKWPIQNFYNISLKKKKIMVYLIDNILFP